MSKTGFIMLNRRFFESEEWLQERKFSLAEAWIDLIQLARFTKNPEKIILKSGKELKIERGEVNASLRYLSNRWQWSINKTRRYVDELISVGKIERRTEQGESILKLCKYDVYNPLNFTTDTPIDTLTDTPIDTLTDTNKNKDNNINNNNIGESFDSPREFQKKLELSFDHVWSLYQKKGNKKTSQARWGKLSVVKKHLALAHISVYVKSTPDKQYRKNFETYINQECWDDEIVKNNKKEDEEKPKYKLFRADAIS